MSRVLKDEEVFTRLIWTVLIDGAKEQKQQSIEEHDILRTLQGILGVEVADGVKWRTFKILNKQLWHCCWSLGLEMIKIIPASNGRKKLR